MFEKILSGGTFCLERLLIQMAKSPIRVDLADILSEEGSRRCDEQTASDDRNTESESPSEAGASEDDGPS